MLPIAWSYLRVGSICFFFLFTWGSLGSYPSTLKRPNTNLCLCCGCVTKCLRTLFFFPMGSSNVFQSPLSWTGLFLWLDPLEPECNLNSECHKLEQMPQSSNKYSTSLLQDFDLGFVSQKNASQQ